MNFIIAQDHNSPEALARRLFAIKDTPGGPTESLAVAALLRANPHLKAGQDVPKGMPILVTDIPGLEMHAVPATRLEASEKVVTQLHGVLSCLGTALKTALAREVKQDQDMLSQLQKAGRKPSNYADNDIDKRLKQIKEAAKTRAKELAQHDKFQKAGLARLEKDLEVLDAL